MMLWVWLYAKHQASVDFDTNKHSVTVASYWAVDFPLLAAYLLSLGSQMGHVATGMKNCIMVRCVRKMIYHDTGIHGQEFLDV